MDHPGKISIVFSVYNEKESLPELFSQLSRFISNSSNDFELVFVDDGSMDDSDCVIRQFKNEEKLKCRIKLIRFSRNFGHEAAMIAGIDHATGDAVICMDADLQHPVELIPLMVADFESGHEIVIMVRKINAGSTWLKKRFSKLFYYLFNQVTDIPLIENASDFFLISKRVAEILKNDYRERHRFLRGIIQTIGFRYKTLEYEAPKRLAGKTKYSFVKLTSLTAKAIVSFSNAPLLMGIWFGFIFAFLSLILGIYSLWVYFFGETPPSGYTTLILFISISFSILFFLLGIIGIYIGYLFDEQKRRPIYLIREGGIET